MGSLLRGSRLRTKVLMALGVALLVVAVGAVVDLVRMRGHLTDGRSAISGLGLDSLDAGLVATMERAAADLTAAHDIAHDSPFLSILGVVPGVRTQVEGIRDLTDVADELCGEAVSSAAAIDVDLEAAGKDPAQRVTLLDTVLTELDRVEAVVEDLDVGATGTLVGPLADARAEVVQELDEAPGRLAEARTYAAGIRRLLAGPTRYLVMAGNNAEMRGGAGMPLSGGVVTITNGDIEFGPFQQLAYLEYGSPPVEYPPVWKTTYFRWNIGRNFPESAVSPNFEVTGPMYETMATAAGFGPVDGVIQVDAVALAHLLFVIGPVEMDGVTYDYANVAQKVLNENYLTFDSLDERGERVDLQANLAAAIFQAFKDREVPVTKLADAMQKAAVGRHLLAHSDDPSVQNLWESAKADGSIPADGLMVTVQNTGANKLDWFIEPSATVNMLRSIDGSWKGRITVAVENPVPPPGMTSDYVDGVLYGETAFYGDPKGTHRALVAVYLPEGAYNIRVSNGEPSEYGVDPPLEMIGTRLIIPRGETVRTSYEFQLPAEQQSATLLPSGRVFPIDVKVNNTPYTDAAPVLVTWSAPDEGGSDDGAAAVAAFLSLAGALAVLVSVRARIRTTSVRPMRALPLFAQHAQTLAALLFLGAMAMLLAGALIAGRA